MKFGPFTFQCACFGLQLQVDRVGQPRVDDPHDTTTVLAERSIRVGA